MKQYKDWDFSDVQFGNLTLNLFYNEGLVDAIVPPSPFFEDKHKDSVNDVIEYIYINDIEVDIEIQSSNVGIYVMASCENEELINLDDLTIEIDYAIELDNIDNGNTAIELDVFKYVPVLSHTTTTSVVLCNIIESHEENFIPYIYLEEQTRLENYQDQNYEFLHFLDLWYMHEVTNEYLREQQKIENIERRQLGQKAKPIPSKKYRKSSKAEILTYYSKFDNKHIIPVAEISTAQDMQKIKHMDYFDKIALRIVFSINTINEIINIYNTYVQELEKFDKFWIIFDSNTLHDYDIINYYISQLIKSEKMQLIYLGAPYTASAISIPRDEANSNRVLNDKTLEIYRELSSAYNTPIWYGDFGGFERRTPSKGMGKPTARVVLRSHKKDNILVRRAWEESDINEKGNIGCVNSMIRLLGDIHSREYIAEEYLNEEICDVDYLFLNHGANSISMGDLKTYCFRHNVCSILHRFVIK